MPEAIAIATLIAVLYGACALTAAGLGMMVGGPRRAAPVASFFFIAVPQALGGSLFSLIGRAAARGLRILAAIVTLFIRYVIDPPLRVLIRAIDVCLGR